MNATALSLRPALLCRGNRRRLLPSLCWAALLGGAALAQGQVALPTAVPVASPVPSPGPSPGTIPSDPALCLPLSATIQLAGLGVSAPALQANSSS